ncbi:hypothetical protein FWF48_03120 [Candidatus Saccharibacteria bacterium]|nr:hypothetical protein [Candidatus Saccharibacteria bacterium]
MAKYYQKHVKDDKYLLDNRPGDWQKVIFVACIQIIVTLCLFLLLQLFQGHSLNTLQGMALKSVGQEFNLGLTFAAVIGFVALMALRIPRFWAIAIGQLLIFWGFWVASPNFGQIILLSGGFLLATAYLYQIFRLRNLLPAILLAIIPIIIVHLV